MADSHTELADDKETPLGDQPYKPVGQIDTEAEIAGRNDITAGKNVSNDSNKQTEPDSGNALLPGRRRVDTPSQNIQLETDQTEPGIKEHDGRLFMENANDEGFHLPEIVNSTPSNTRFNGSNSGSNPAKEKSNTSFKLRHEMFLNEKQPSEITQAISISGVLRDVEFDNVPHSLPASEMDDHTMDMISNETHTTQVESEHSKLPQISTRRKTRRKHTTKKPAPKAISKRRKGYEHIYVYRHVIHYRSRITRVFTKPPKITLLRSEANFIRLCNIIITLGSVLLRDVFKAHMERLYPPKDLRQFLENYKRRMISFASTEKLLSSRWKLLYPDDDSHSPTVDKLEPSLVFWFLRHLCHLTKPNDILWKMKPAYDDVTVAADIARIRDMRNSFINCVEKALYDEEFDRKIEEIKTITIRLTGQKRASELLEKLRAMKTMPVKDTDREAHLKVLQEWADETKDQDIGKIIPCRQDWETLNECKVMTKRFLKRFKRSKVFTRTKMYQQAKEKLISNGFVILKGNTGEGKTTTALGLIASMFDDDDMLVISSFEQAKYINRHSVGALLIDDLLGSMHLDEKQYSEWEPYFDKLYKLCLSGRDATKSGHSSDSSTERKEKPSAKVIITMRKHIFDQMWSKLSRYKLFSGDFIVNCESKELLFQEKRTILARHITADNRVRSEVDSSARLPISRLGFPQSCALFISQAAFMDLGSQFFEDPIGVVQGHLDKLYHNDMYGYLTLVVMMFQPAGALFIKKLQEFTDEAFRTQVLDLAAVCEVPVTEHLAAHCLMALANSLKSYIYYYDDIGCYTFLHESILEIMMSTFVERHPQHVLETCALQFIMDYVATEDNVNLPRDQVFVMRIQKHFFWLMAQLFDHYINYGHVYKVAHHRVFRDPKFLNFFIDYVNKREMKDEMILQVDSTVKDMEEDRHVGLLYGAVDQDVPNADLAIAILKLGVHVRRPFNPEWCLLELTSSLCVAIRRRSYRIYHAIASTKIDIPDKVMHEKEYLTSVKIVTDILARRAWSKEQKDIALIRAARQTETESTEVAALLLLHGASVSSIRMGTTALCEAVKSGTTKTVSLLLMNGASIYDRDLNEQTPLHHACDWNREEITKLLLQKGADINTKDVTMLTPFLVAAGWGRMEVMDILLTMRADTLATDEQENTVLHICAAAGQTAIMRLVMDKFPDEMQSILIARNKYGWTPLDFAMKCGHLGVTKILVRAILKNDTPRPNRMTFVHTRFNVVKLVDLNRDEMHLQRFVDLDSDKECFQVPRCKWYIHAGSKEEYDKVTLFVSKYEDRLKLRGAKT